MGCKEICRLWSYRCNCNLQGMAGFSVLSIKTKTAIAAYIPYWYSNKLPHFLSSWGQWAELKMLCSFAFPCVLGHGEAMNIAWLELPFHLQGHSLLTHCILAARPSLTVTTPSPTFTSKILVMALGLAAKSGNFYPTVLSLIISANSVFPFKVTYHGFWGLGCRHLWGSMPDIVGGFTRLLWGTYRYVHCAVLGECAGGTSGCCHMSKA